MSFPPFAKAIVAAVLTGAAPSVAAATSATGVTSTSTIESIVGAVAAALATYWVPNGKSPKGLVVTVKTDVETFLASFIAGLPGLVRSSAQDAVTPKAAPAAPADPAPVDPAAATVEPAILGKA
jgi:hypothetical protein